MENKGVLAATILASGTSFLIGSAVTIALPTIQQEFGTAVSAIQWVVSSYALALAVLIPVSGLLGDRYGRKKMFMAGTAIFTLGALLSGLSGSIFHLIGFQALQGIGGALMIPESLAIISSTFSRNERGTAIGLWSGFSGGLAAFGPLFGGWLVDSFGWSWVFLSIVPLGALTLLLTFLYVPESRDEQAREVSWTGTVLLGLSLTGIAYALIQGPKTGWNTLVMASLAGGLVFSGAFAYHQRKSSHQMVPRRIMTRTVIGANIATLSLYFALQGLMFTLTLALQQFREYSAVQAGLALLPATILITFLSWAGGKAADRYGSRPGMVAGPLVVALGIAWIGFAGTGGYWSGIFPGLVLFGAGMAAVIAPLTKSALDVPEKYSGMASGVNNGVSRLSYLMAVALGGAVLLALFSLRLPGELAGLPEDKQQEIISQAGKLGEINITFQEGSQIAQEAIDESFEHGFSWTMFMMALLAAGAAAVSYFTIER